MCCIKKKNNKQCLSCLDSSRTKKGGNNDITCSLWNLPYTNCMPGLRNLCYTDTDPVHSGPCPSKHHIPQDTVHVHNPFHPSHFHKYKYVPHILHDLNSCRGNSILSILLENHQEHNLYHYTAKSASVKTK